MRVHVQMKQNPQKIFWTFTKSLFLHTHTRAMGVYVVFFSAAAVLQWFVLVIRTSKNEVSDHNKMGPSHMAQKSVGKTKLPFQINTGERIHFMGRPNLGKCGLNAINIISGYER